MTVSAAEPSSQHLLRVELIDLVGGWSLRYVRSRTESSAGRHHDRKDDAHPPNSSPARKHPKTPAARDRECASAEGAGCAGS